MRLRNIPLRLAAGGYILHTGLEKWGSDEERATGLHGMASGAYPAVESVPPSTFVRALSAAEIAVGAALLAPVVPARAAGAVLTGFAGGLVTLYARTPALRKPGSIWPSAQGTAVSKDSWLLGIGLALLLDRKGGRGGRRGKRAGRKNA